MSYRCPCCHEIIYSDWRQNRWRTNVWFIQWDQADPELSQKLRDTKEVQTDQYYAYRNAGKVIERILLEEFNVGGTKAFHIPREKTKSLNRSRNNQTKLVN
jgi:hypothetical protein